jgi:hypothetical protein
MTARQYAIDKQKERKFELLKQTSMDIGLDKQKHIHRLFNTESHRKKRNSPEIIKKRLYNDIFDVFEAIQYSEFKGWDSASAGITRSVRNLIVRDVDTYAPTPQDHLKKAFELTGIKPNGYSYNLNNGHIQIYYKIKEVSYITDEEKAYFIRFCHWFNRDGGDLKWTGKIIRNPFCTEACRYTYPEDKEKAKNLDYHIFLRRDKFCYEIDREPELDLSTISLESLGDDRSLRDYRPGSSYKNKLKILSIEKRVDKRLYLYLYLYLCRKSNNIQITTQITSQISSQDDDLVLERRSNIAYKSVAKYYRNNPDSKKEDLVNLITEEYKKICTKSHRSPKGKTIADLPKRIDYLMKTYDSSKIKHKFTKENRENSIKTRQGRYKDNKSMMTYYIENEPELNWDRKKLAEELNVSVFMIDKYLKEENYKYDRTKRRYQKNNGGRSGESYKKSYNDDGGERKEERVGTYSAKIKRQGGTMAAESLSSFISEGSLVRRKVDSVPCKYSYLGKT